MFFYLHNFLFVYLQYSNPLLVSPAGGSNIYISLLTTVYSVYIL